jgi:hypothetical protein
LDEIVGEIYSLLYKLKYLKWLLDFYPISLILSLPW